jgi:hypothetical protein
MVGPGSRSWASVGTCSGESAPIDLLPAAPALICDDSIQNLCSRPQICRREDASAQARPNGHRARAHSLSVDINCRQGHDRRPNPAKRHDRAHARQCRRERRRRLQADCPGDAGRDWYVPCGDLVQASACADPCDPPAIVDVHLLLRSNALRVLLQSFSEGPHELAPSVALVLLYVADAPATRSALRPGSDIEMALSGFTDVYGSGESHLNRLKASHKVVSTMLRSWTGA